MKTDHSTIARKIAIGGVAAGLLLGGWAVIAGPDTERVPAAADLTPVTATESAQVELVSTGGRTLDEMATLWRDRAEAAPADYLSRHSLASVLLTQAREEGDLDRYVEAELLLREALEINGEYIPNRMALASALAAQHRFSEALEIAEAVLADDPGYLPALAAVGDAHFELGDYDAAATAFADLAAIERSAPVLSRLARLAVVTGDAGEAVDLATEALAQSRDLDLRPADAAFYWFQLGVFQYDAGRVADSIASLEEARRIAPDQSGAAEKLASVLTAEGRLDEAIVVTSELVEGGGPADLHAALADLLTRTGDPDAGAEQLAIAQGLVDETLERYPAERRHVIGMLLDLDPSRALELAQEEIGDRQDVHGWDTLAWALHLNGRSSEAAEAMRSALAPGIRDAGFFFHAGVIAAAEGDAEGARGYLEAALEINPRFDLDDAVTARTMLAELG